MTIMRCDIQLILRVNWTIHIETIKQMLLIVLCVQKGFRANLLLKDMNLGKSLADSKKTPTTLTRETIEIYEKIAEKGWGNKDFSIAYKYFKELQQ